ncbi:MAG: hypothetical protein ACOC22_01450 [bacterium]
MTRASMRIVVNTTPQTVIESKTENFNEEEFEAVTNLIEQAAKGTLNYMSLDTKEGNKVYLNKKILSNSIIYIIKD